MVLRRIGFALLMLVCLGQVASAETLAELSESFWQWRAAEQPFTNDDIPRIDRPVGFRVDWAAATVATRLDALAKFEQRWHALTPAANSTVPEQVDYRLVGAAIARVRWELALEQNWKRNPGFYVDQTVGSVFVLLLPPPPFSAARQGEIVARMRQIPATLSDGKANLTDMRQPFVQLAIDGLDDVVGRMQATVAALTPELTPENATALKAAAGPAAKALVDYRAWLQTKLAGAKTETAIGRENYLWFLRNVALIPYTPEEMLALSRQEWSRAVSFEAYEQGRLAGKPPATIFPSAAAQIEQERLDEASVRRFLTEQKILTVPDWMRHYQNQLLPKYLEPFEDLGVTDDLTGPGRLTEPGTSYIHTPSPSLGYFFLSTAKDPRPIIVHEGVPGHYFQLALGWHQADPIRRHYYDSGANEGIGFYAEEMMLQAGLFEDRPRTREIIDSFMRLRALRVEVDVKLALGQFSLQQAAEYLASTVPMDKKTAVGEAAMFASTPGQAITYQIGKVQIMQMLADARRQQGSAFSLQAFHDFVWTNGNVPIALQRWELLGDATDVPPIQ